MLQKLHIRNYAIIEDLDIRFTQHLNIITGETGAGKSILMGALGLLLGDRADTSVLLDKEKKCIVEGLFIHDQKEVETFLEKNDLDSDKEIIIRREISAAGKSRAFINDTPATLIQLKQLTAHLVDLHRQFDTLELNNIDFQREVLDALAGNRELLHSYQNIYKDYKHTLDILEKLKNRETAATKEYDYKKFLFDELEEAAFRDGEIETLDGELEMMSHAEDIKSTLASIYGALEEGEEPWVQQLKVMASRLDALISILPAVTPLGERIKSAGIELQDIAGEIDRLNQNVTYSEARVTELNDRMSVAYGLLKKHSVQTTAELQEVQVGLEHDLQEVTDLSEEIARKEKLSTQLEEQATKLAGKISESRKSIIPDLVKQVNKLLKQVGMPAAKFLINMAGVEMNFYGSDSIEFSIDANKSGHYEPLRKVASGGELSRIMLIIKSLVAAKIKLPTLIFDEIDTGISGEAARQVGRIMKELSENHQILLVTHQAQIAACAYTHYLVYKEEKNKQIKTLIKKLDEQERVHAIAVMLSGEKPSAAAFENARDLILQ